MKPVKVLIKVKPNFEKTFKFSNTIAASLFIEKVMKTIPNVLQANILEKQLKGKCSVCKNKAKVIRMNILNRSFGKESPIKLCSNCDKNFSDFELICHFLPMSKWNLAKRFVYGSTKIPPSLMGKPIYGEICIQDIKPVKLEWHKMKPTKIKGGL